jgi:hypothetical protein
MHSAIIDPDRHGGPTIRTPSMLIALGVTSALLLSVTACATSHASVTTFIATPAGRHVVNSPLTLARVQLDATAFQADATTNTATYLVPSFKPNQEEMAIYCVEPDPRTWTQLASDGGLGTLDAHSHVHVMDYAQDDPARNVRIYSTVLTDDGYVGSVCFRDLSFGN